MTNKIGIDRSPTRRHSSLPRPRRQPDRSPLEERTEPLNELQKKPALEARVRILQAAEALFAEKGYAATRVQEITDAAGVNKALLYYYFEDKRALYVALMEDGIDAFRTVVEAALEAPGSYAERLERLVTDHVALLWRRPNLLRVVQRSQMAGDVPDLNWRDQFQVPFSRVVEFFREAAGAGEFESFDPEMTARSVLALDTGFARLQDPCGPRLEAEQVSAHITRLLLSGLRRTS